MGRPQEFDTEAVVEAALLLFWERGLYRTSIENLLAANHFSKSSFYNTFKDKDAIFERAAKRYIDQHVASLQKMLDTPSIEEGSRKLFYCPVTNNFDGKGSLLVNCASNLVEEDATERRLIQKGFKRVFSVVEARILLAQECKQVSKSVNPAAAATLVCANLSGLGAFQKAGLPRKSLKNAAESALKALMQFMQ